MQLKNILKRYLSNNQAHLWMGHRNKVCILRKMIYYKKKYMILPFEARRPSLKSIEISIQACVRIGNGN